MAGLLNWLGRGVDAVLPGDQSGLHKDDKRQQQPQQAPRQIAPPQPQRPQISGSQKVANFLSGIPNIHLDGLTQLRDMISGKQYNDANTIAGGGTPTPSVPVTIGSAARSTPILKQAIDFANNQAKDPNQGILHGEGELIKGITKTGTHYAPYVVPEVKVLDAAGAGVMGTLAAKGVNNALPAIGASTLDQVAEGNRNIGDIAKNAAIAGAGNAVISELPVIRGLMKDHPPVDDMPIKLRSAPVPDPSTPPSAVLAAAHDLVKQVTPHNDAFAGKLQAIGQALGHDVLHGPIKEAGRIAEKAHLDYGGDLSQVKDAVRGTVHASNPADLQAHLDEIGKHFDISRTKTLDGSRTYGYQDTKVNVKLPSGHDAEIIVATPEMLAAKKIGHSLYEEARALEHDKVANADQLAKLEAQMRDIYGQAQEAVNTRLASSSEISSPLKSASEGEKGLPVDRTVPLTDRPSDTSRTTVPSTLKNRTNDSAIDGSLSTDNIPQSNVKIKPTQRPTQTLNTDRLNISEDAKPEVQALSQPEVLQTLSNEEVQRIARSAGIDTKSHSIEQQRQRIAEKLNLRQKIVSLTNQADEALAKNDLTVRAKLMKEIQELSQVSRAQGTEVARELQARKILANELDTPLQIVFKLLDEAGVNPAKYTEAAAHVDFNDAAQVIKFYRSYVPPKAKDWIDLIRYNSMLSSPKTQIVNIGSTVGNIMNAPVEKELNALLDTVHHLVTGKPRTRAGGEGIAFAKGASQSFPQALTDFKRAMHGLEDSAQTEGLKEGRVPMSAPGDNKLHDILEFPMKTLGAFDAAMKALVRGGSMKSLEVRAAHGIKLPGQKELISDAEAAYRTFNQDLGDKSQGYIYRGLDEVTAGVMKLRASQNPVVAYPAKFTLPFVRIGVNLLKHGTEHSIVGLAGIPGSSDKVAALSRVIMGTATMGAAGGLLGQGRLTWAEPTNAKQKAEFRAAGMQPYSVKIGNNWISFAKLPPILSFNFAMVAALDDTQKYSKLDQGGIDNVVTAIAKYGNFLSDQSYTKSLGDALAAIKGDPEKFTSLIGNYPQQLVPFRALSGWFANMTDDTQRKINTDAGFAQKQVQNLMMNIPGLRESVPERKDNSDQPIPAQHPVLNAFTPTNVTTENATGKEAYDKLRETAIDTANKKLETAAAKESGEKLSGSKVLDDAQARIDDAKKKLPKGISESSSKTILLYARLNDDGKAKFNSNPKNEYELAKARYEQKSLGGKMSAYDDFKEKQSLGKMSITSKYSKDVQDLYGMSKNQRTAFLGAHPEQAKLMDDVSKMSAELAGRQFSSGDKIAKAKKGRKPKSLAGTYTKGSAGSKAARSATIKVKSSNTKVAKAKVKAAGKPKVAKITTRKQLA